jgi:hypothetical protein
VHTNIVSVKPDCDPRGPRIWSLANRTMINTDDLDKFMQPGLAKSLLPGQLLSLPTTVAYEGSLMKQLQIRIQSISKTGYGKYVRFMSHPFNFNLLGKLRPFENTCMTIHDHKMWLRKRKTEERFAAAESSQFAFPAVPSPATDDNLATNSATQTDSMFESNDVPGKAESNDPTTTFEHIMETLAEHETISPEETALQHKLSEAQAQLQAEKERADIAAQELIEEKLKTTKSEHECVAY